MGRIPHLRARLAEYDLLVTHFGIGAFAAVYARLPVLLVSPGFYHERLSRKAGFFSLGIGAGAAGRLGKLIRGFGSPTKPDLLKTLERKSKEIVGRFGLWEDQKETIASFLCRVSPRSPLVCPLCGSPRATPVLARFPEESYRQCPHCGVIYLARLNDAPVAYEKDYFFSDYKKQYGKTYLEDFPNLVETGKRRLERINKLLRISRRGAEAKGIHTPHPTPHSLPSILDIGCAYGPFLAAAALRGFSPAGVEPAPDAARYVKETLGFPCYHGFFPAAASDEIGESGKSDEDEIEEIRRLSNNGVFDAVTLWYVIEHFEEAGKVLRRIHGLLKDGGALAFSTPSFSGVSGRKSPASFLKNSPPDHFIVLSTIICAWILRRYGFRLRKIVVTGHHPERFPLIGRFADPAGKGTLYRFLLFISRLFSLGDTFEVYAVKA
jgi:2-polyprenyl-3-methyl-5-hydroxy-6-metoxy-1,4-benzoquinol methylase